MDEDWDAEDNNTTMVSKPVSKPSQAVEVDDWDDGPSASTSANMNWGSNKSTDDWSSGGNNANKGGGNNSNNGGNNNPFKNGNRNNGNNSRPQSGNNNGNSNWNNGSNNRSNNSRPGNNGNNDWGSGSSNNRNNNNNRNNSNQGGNDDPWNDNSNNSRPNNNNNRSNNNQGRNNDSWNQNSNGAGNNNNNNNRNNQGRSNNDDWSNGGGSNQNSRSGNNNRNNNNQGKNNDSWNDNSNDSWGNSNTKSNNNQGRSDNNDWSNGGGSNKNSRPGNNTNNQNDNSNDGWNGGSSNRNAGNNGNGMKRSRSACNDGNNDKQSREGDWTCADCNQSNFARRRDCYKCSQPKPKDAKRDSSTDGWSGGKNNGGGGGGGGGGENKQRPGDWACSCGHSNWSFRKECQKCQSEKPAGAGDSGDGEDGEKKPPRSTYVPVETSDNDLYGTNLPSGTNFEAYDNIKVQVNGEDVPPAIADFKSSGLHPHLLKVLIEKMKYSRPTPVQRHGIPIGMAKRDLMACSQTGSGKTAAFLLPMIDDILKNNIPVTRGKPIAVIMSPTRELAIQIFEEAKKLSLGTIVRCCLIYGGTDTRHQRNQLQNGCHILVATPGRLMDFSGKSFVTYENIQYVVLDEADRMLDMGFKEKINELMDNETMSPAANRNVFMFSATMPKEIQQMAGRYLNRYIFLTVGIVGGACADVDQTFFQIAKNAKRKKLMELLTKGDPSGTIIFVESKKQADYLASFLCESDVDSTSIHGDRTQQQREQALNEFKRGIRKIIIATAVASRGLDIKTAKHVINYEMPKNIDEYIHRIGRTGRVGNKGRSTSFFDPDQNSDLGSDLVTILKQAKQPVPEFLQSYGGGGDFGGGDFGGSCGKTSNDDNWDDSGPSDIRQTAPSTSSAPQVHGTADEEEW